MQPTNAAPKKDICHPGNLGKPGRRKDAVRSADKPAVKSLVKMPGNQSTSAHFVCHSPHKLADITNPTQTRLIGKICKPVAI